MTGPKGDPLAGIERLSIALPSEMAAAVKEAVDAGDYESTDEVIRSALRDWALKRTLGLDEVRSLKADLAAGLADLAAGKVKSFERDRIVEQGRKRLAARSPSA